MVNNYYFKRAKILYDYVNIGCLSDFERMMAFLDLYATATVAQYLLTFYSLTSVRSKARQADGLCSFYSTNAKCTERFSNQFAKHSPLASAQY